MKIGLLDLGERQFGQVPRSALQETITRARVSEELGFSRYWLSEHQGYQDNWGNPEVAIAAIAMATRSIAVGCAGVLFGAHDPVRVGNDFCLLETMFPDRVDLGLARLGPALRFNIPDPKVTAEAPEAFGQKVDVLLDLFYGLRPDDSRYAEAVVLPAPTSIPRIWLLGSSDASSQIASAKGLRYAHSLFHERSLPAPDVVSRYIQCFDPSAMARRIASKPTERAMLHSFECARPEVIIAVAVACAPTQQEACQIASEFINPFIRPTLVGTPEYIITKLGSLESELGVREFVLLDVAAAHGTRLRSMQLLSDALARVDDLTLLQ